MSRGSSLLPTPTAGEPEPGTGAASPSATPRLAIADLPTVAWRQAPRGARWVGMVVTPVVVALLLLLALWQSYASRAGGNALVLPTPFAVWSTLIHQRAALWDNALVTLLET